MSLRVIKAGIFDSIQDAGRYGYQRFGINPTGAMDVYACRMANLLVGNHENDPVIELHFPASTFLFEHSAIIALTGADFSATIDHQFISMDTPVFVAENSILQFTNPRHGARCYMAVMGSFDIQKWLGSYSTNLKAAIGGYNGRRLMKDDVLPFRMTDNSISRKSTDMSRPVRTFSTNKIMILPGPEWDWLSEDDQSSFLKNEFSISRLSDRMGYRLDGRRIFIKRKEELVSSAVTFGTIQLFPDGSLALLMADHQTTGGYPRIATVITACHSACAQKKPGDSIRFALTEIHAAEKLFFEHESKLEELRNKIILKKVPFRGFRG